MPAVTVRRRAADYPRVLDRLMAANNGASTPPCASTWP
jgi:hypothetical protein